MRESLRILLAIQNYLNSRTWMLGLVLKDLEAGDTFLHSCESLKTVYDTLVPMGMGFAIMYFVMNLCNAVTEDNVSMDIIVKSFVKLCMACFFIKCGYDILLYMADIGQAMAKEFIQGNLEMDYVAIGNSIRYSFWNTFFNFMLAVPNLLYLILVFIVSKVVVWTRTLELGFYLLIAPFAFPNIAEYGFSGAGLKYIKKILALAIQGAIMGITVVICSRISDAILVEDKFYGVVSYLLIGTILLKSLFDSKKTAQNIVGVR